MKSLKSINKTKIGKAKVFLGQCIKTNDHGFYQIELYNPEEDCLENFLFLINQEQEDPDIIASACIENSYIYSFIVDSDYRGMGYGERFLKFAIEQCGVSQLIVAKNNEIALNLYRKPGFKEKETNIELGNEYLYMEL